MKSRVAPALVLALFAAGCQPKRAAYTAYEDKAEKVALRPPPTSNDTSTAAESASGPAAPSPAQAPQQGGAALLAYSYQYEIEAPPARIADLLHQHERACVAAGASRCQVLGETLGQIGREQASGRLQLQAEPHWLDRFRASLEADARADGGRVVGSNVQTEDLTRSIVDTDAALRTKRDLRDRLEALLQRPSNSVKDLLATEQELARVQGEIDTAQSELAVARARVQMSALDIAYRSTSSLAPDSAFSPVVGAAHGFLRNLMLSLSALLTFAAFAAPFLLVLAACAWAWRRSRRSRRGPTA